MEKYLILLMIITYPLFQTFGQIRYIVNTDSSKLIWIGKKISGEHKGKIKISKGDFVIDKNNNITTGKFEIDMKTISNDDLVDQASKAKLEKRLKSTDIFDVENFPSAKFEIKGPLKIEMGNIKIIGDLTIKDVTKTIEFKAIFMYSTDGYKVFASFFITRSQFNIKYGTDTFFGDITDKVINDNFQVLLNLSINKADAAYKK